MGDDPEAPQEPVRLTVTGEMPSDLPEPEAGATLTLGEYVIGIPWIAGASSGECARAGILGESMVMEVSILPSRFAGRVLVLCWTVPADDATAS